MAKHTPGPWQHDRERSMGGAPIIVGKRGDRNRMREVAKVLFDNGSDDPEVRANARLIAAAPDLLGALKAAGEALDAASAAICEWDQHDPSVAARCNLAYRQICVAIAKAEPT